MIYLIGFFGIVAIICVPVRGLYIKRSKEKGVLSTILLFFGYITGLIMIMCTFSIPKTIQTSIENNIYDKLNLAFDSFVHVSPFTIILMVLTFILIFISYKVEKNNEEI